QVLPTYIGTNRNEFAYESYLSITPV
ncbi:MAG: hypothetical protein JWR48_4644, partial [Mycobacterium sp.]|nr:hypothetical protein [Mycobacterium sp.]